MRSDAFRDGGDEASSNGYFRLFKVDKLEGVDTGSAIFPSNIVTPCTQFAYKTLGLWWRSAFVTHGRKFMPRPTTRSFN